MDSLLSRPVFFFVFSLVLLWLSAQAGAFLQKRRPLQDDARDDFQIVEAASLTLLGLIMGFSFSMAMTRYDQRKYYEEAEANAIGTEYARADLLPGPDGAKVRALLISYLDQRILFYVTHDERRREEVNAATAQRQAEMWTAVQAPAMAQPTPVNALAVAGMNDVLNSQGYTQAAWWNRIPTAAWILMLAVAIFSNGMIGYGVHTRKANTGVLFILPLLVSVAFLLISDIDSPRRGLISVTPQNLISLRQSLRK
jgi:hypothetical protein